MSILRRLGDPCDSSDRNSLCVSVSGNDIYDGVANAGTAFMSDGTSVLFPGQIPDHTFYENLSRRVERREAHKFLGVFVAGVIVGVIIRSVL